MAGISVKIEGRAVLATSDVVWELTQGVTPYIGRFDLPAFQVQELRTRAGPVTLEIDDGVHQTIKVERLYIVGDAPGPNPEIETIIVADRRYWWPYAHILRRYNMRRKIGHKRIQADDTLELHDVKKDVWYAPYSMPDGNSDSEPWTARDALNDIMAEIIKHEPDQGSGLGMVIESLPEIDNIPIEDLVVDDNGPDALRRVLEAIPGVGLTLKVDGTVILYSRVDGKESRPVDEEWREYKNFGHLKKVSKALIRPRRVEVLFTREIEIRADFEDFGDGSGSGANQRPKDEIWADNVLPMPDYNFVNASGDTVPRGTWVPIQEALSKWNSGVGDESPVEKLTTLAIRRSMVPFGGMWTNFIDQGLKDPDNDWGGRIAQIQANWRVTYRLNSRLVDRTLGIYAHRMATINPETGDRAPAVCYSDYCIFPGSRMFFQADEREEFFYAMNFLGYPTENNDQGHGRLDDNTKPAPALVTVVDRDQGIIHVNWKIDPLRTFEKIMPGTIQNPNGAQNVAGRKPSNPGPMSDLTDRQENITFNSVTSSSTSSVTEMSGGYKCIMMLTAVPASPNNDSQLQRVVVRPDDVKDLLPDAMAGGLSNAQGPVMEVRIGPGKLTARVRWLDDEYKEIYKALGINNDNAGDDGEEADIDKLVINLDESGNKAGAASLTAVARAAAASVYATFADRTEGSAGYELQPTHRPEGRVDSVAFGVTASGLPHTMITVPEDFPSIDLRALMPASDRALWDQLAGRDI